MHLYWIFAKAPGFGVMVITLAEFAIGFAYGALLEGFWNGQTIGKRLFHLRVIDQAGLPLRIEQAWVRNLDRKSTRLNSSHGYISYAVFCLKKKKMNSVTLATDRACLAP